jgi:hypothetical protein
LELAGLATNYQGKLSLNHTFENVQQELPGDGEQQALH